MPASSSGGCYWRFPVTKVVSAIDVGQISVVVAVVGSGGGKRALGMSAGREKSGSTQNITSRPHEEHDFLQ